MRVHLYVILCSIWIALLPLVVTISIFMLLCGRMLVERNIPERVWPQQLGTFEFKLGMIPPPDSDVEHRRWTLSETYASPANNRDRSTHGPDPIRREELAIVHSSLQVVTWALYSFKKVSLLRLVHVTPTGKPIHSNHTSILILSHSLRSIK